MAKATARLATLARRLKGLLTTENRDPSVLMFTGTVRLKYNEIGNGKVGGGDQPASETLRKGMHAC